MNTGSKICLAVLILGLFLSLGGCFVDWEPEEILFVMTPGQTQTFQVNDPGDGVRVVWLLDDKEVAKGVTSYTYTAEENPGDALIAHHLEVQAWQDKPILKRLRVFNVPLSYIYWQIRVLAPQGPEPCYQDKDGDGFGDPRELYQSPNPPANCVYNGTDCNDHNAEIHPAAEDLPCNATDENCDGLDACR